MAGSGEALFDRRCRLTIANPVATPNDFKNVTTEVIEIDGGTTDDKTITGLRVRFDIKKSLKKEPNPGEIVVTNLSPKRRASLQQKGVRVTLEAGYKASGVTRIFTGDVRTIDHVRSGADWDTTLKLGDGERAWQYARVYESFAEGTAARDVLKAAVKGLGVEEGNLNKAISDVTKKIDQGFAIAGSAARAVDQIVKSLGMSWSVQDGQFQLLKPDAVLDLPIPEVSVSSGLIGSPEMGSPATKGKPALVKFKSLLIPMRPGTKVKLVSERYNGFVRVESCAFTGDTHGGNWFTEIAASILK